MKFEKRTFKNGLRAVVAPMKDTQAMTLLALFGTGSKYEIKKLNGISHFLEHLFFKGTKHRPKAGQLNLELDRLGAESNAFTSKEYTGYYVKAAAKHFDVALDIVSDILLEPLFKSQEIEKERGVILQELSMYEDNPQRQAYEVFEDLLYGDQPAGWMTGGYPDTVKNIMRNDIVQYKNSHYLTSNAVIAVAGNIDQGRVFRKIEKVFSKMSQGEKVEKLKVAESQSRPQIKFKKKNVDQTHIRLGVRTYDMYDDRRYPMSVLNTIIGGNWSSRLFTELREKLGLAYYVRSGVEQYTDTGYLIASAGIPHGTLPKVTEKIVKIFSSAKKRGVSAKEIKFAKEYIRGSMGLAFESSDEVAMYLASQEIFYKKILTPDEVLAKIEKVQKGDIMGVARDVFSPEKINLAAVTPDDNIKPFDKILLRI